jgi:membrane-bound lytic murein transglycosylase D
MKLTQVCLLASVLSACSMVPKQDATQNIDVANSAQAISTSENLDDTQDSGPELSSVQVENTIVDAPTLDVWGRIIHNLALTNNVDNPRVDKHLSWFVRHPQHVKKVSERAQRYLFHISAEVEARGMPGELALLPFIESAFDPFAYSHGRASGVWQFIPSTGHMFGLKQDWWHDGRRDIRASTNAALTYLDRLQKRFDGDWMLALASYNSGAGTVNKAIRKNKKKGLPTDFWHLDLPKETRAYVPKLIALAKLLKQRENYDLEWSPVLDQPYFAVADTQGQIDLAQVAELAESEIDEIYRLNPQYNHWATHPDGPHEVLVPADKFETFSTNLSLLDPTERMRWDRYKVRRGDNLIIIADKHETTVSVLRRANELSSDVIFPGQELMIPSAMKGGSEYSLSLDKRLEKRQLRGRTTNQSKRIDYYVKSGDSFWKIARLHDTSVNKLTNWNGMAPGDPLTVGKRLVIWTTNDTKDRQVVRKVNYQIRSGDNLSSIANRFNVNVSDVKRWNSNTARRKYLQPGQSLTLYVDVTK